MWCIFKRKKNHYSYYSLSRPLTTFIPLQDSILVSILNSILIIKGFMNFESCKRVISYAHVIRLQVINHVMSVEFAIKVKLSNYILLCMWASSKIIRQLMKRKMALFFILFSEWLVCWLLQYYGLDILTRIRSWRISILWFGK